MAVPRTSAPVITDPTDVASVLLEDPDLGQHLDTTRAEIAARRALARVITVPRSEFRPHECLPTSPDILGMLVLEGLLLRGVKVDDRPTIEVLGPGSVVRPCEAAEDSYATVPARVTWWALKAARLAVIDGGFLRRMGDFPEVTAALAGRLSLQSAGNCLRLSIVRQPRLTSRLHLMLWYLADRYGRVHADGILLPVPLCHGLLSRLVGAGRPAVSRAVKELERAGRIASRPDGTWWLAREPPEGLAESPPAVQPVAA